MCSSQHNQQANKRVLKRQYKEGDVLKYKIIGKGTNNPDYYAEAVSVVKKGPDGIFHEEFQWHNVQENGKAASIPPDFRQLVSLDTKYKVTMPSLFHSPFFDALNFYVDDMIAIKHMLGKKGEHIYLKHGTPNSWADGKRVIMGYDCIDFDVTLVDIDEHIATLQVRHVPPVQGCNNIPPAAWMQKPVSDTANNWFQVTKTGDNKYEASVGKEVFDVELKVELPSGIIKSATMFNPVVGEERICTDAKLTDCGVPKKFELVRNIALFLEQ